MDNQPVNNSEEVKALAIAMLRERQRAWRERNREHVNATARAWYAANKDRIKAKRATRLAGDPEYREKQLAYHRDYYVRNKERINGYNREYKMRRSRVKAAAADAAGEERSCGRRPVLDSLAESVCRFARRLFDGRGKTDRS